MDDYGYVKLSAATPVLKVGNPAYNAGKIAECMELAFSEGASVLVTPELSLTGSTCGDLFWHDSLDSACRQALSQLLITSERYDMAVVIGLPIRVGNSLYNCALVLHKGTILGVCPKEYPASYGPASQSRWFSCGTKAAVEHITICNQTVAFGKMLFALGERIKLGVELSQDSCTVVTPGGLLALSGANVIVNPSACCETVDCEAYRERTVSHHSAAQMSAYIYVNAGTGESTTDMVFGGNALICENGTVLARGKRFSRKNELITACVDLEKLEYDRRRSSLFADNAAAYAIKDLRTVSCDLAKFSPIDFDRIIDPYPFLVQDETLREQRCEEIFNIQASGLAKRLEHTGLKRCMIGISGGLDSTLALLVAIRALELLGLPHQNVIAVTMPGFGTTGRTYHNALELMQSLYVTVREIPIAQACLRHFEDIGHDPSNHDVTYENSQARERTQILMDLANAEGALVVGTGDLSEAAMGWSTYNGDHMSMYGVNAGVPKTLVRHLVAYVAAQTDEDISAILCDILDTPVSPELLPPDSNGEILQKTEDRIGPYELHDFFLYHFLRYGASREKLLFLATKAFAGIYDRNTVDKWLKVFLKRFFASQFKRTCTPDAPKIGSIGLSPRGDWCMPTDADASAWLE